MKADKILWILVALCAIGLIYGVAQNGAVRRDLKKMEQQSNVKIAALEIQNKDLTANNELLYKDNVEKDKEIATVQKDRDRDKGELARNAVTIADLKDKIQQGPPEYVLSETRRILKTDEVRLRETFAAFSISAFRTNGDRLTEWENFSLVVVPNLRGQLNSAGQENILLGGKVLNLEGIHKNDVQIQENDKKEKAELRGTITELKEYYKTLRKSSLLNNVLKIGGAFLAGYLIGR
jgi:hypothetical protein